jgi:hypothetical protein
MKKQILQIGLVVLLALTVHFGANAQGCVAIRNFASCGNSLSNSNILTKGQLQVGLNYRYFRSFRHFRGTHEEKERLEENTEVINYAHAWDLNFTYGLSSRFYLSATLPFVYNERSSLYEHGRTERHSTFSGGLADARIGAGFWILDPEKHINQNIAVGLGVKMPTGNYNTQGLFHNVKVGDQLMNVRQVLDQSIQLGDGGWGATVDLQAYQKIAGTFYAYLNGFYLFNPMETNGVNTRNSTTTEFSVPDQYAARLGVNYGITRWGVSFSLGGRFEAVPTHDLIGSSKGYRRPGNVFSVEPGVSFTRNKLGLTLTVPVALARQRPQSVMDIERQQQTGTPTNGDAAFADYLINFGVSYKLSLKKMEN